MWFKNIRVYRFTKPFTLTTEEINKALADSPFIPCNSQDQLRFGWVSPVSGTNDDSDYYVHAAQNYMMVCLKKQEKILPAAVINEVLNDKVDAIEEAEGRAVGRKEKQSLKDDVIMELLPKAFTRSRLQYAYIAPEQGYIVVDAASASKAEELLSALREALGVLSAVPLASKQIPVQVMTRWVNDATAPDKFTLGDECELADPKASGSVIRCKQQDLFSEEINNLLQSGMIVTKLNLQWRDGISFILDDQLAIKRLRFEDNIRDKADNLEAQNSIEQFDMDFSVMTIELSAFIKDLLLALGGINTEHASVDEIMAKAAKADTTDKYVEEVTFA